MLLQLFFTLRQPRHDSKIKGSTRGLGCLCCCLTGRLSTKIDEKEDEALLGIMQFIRFRTRDGGGGGGGSGTFLTSRERLNKRRIKGAHLSSHLSEDLLALRGFLTLQLAFLQVRTKALLLGHGELEQAITKGLP